MLKAAGEVGKLFHTSPGSGASPWWRVESTMTPAPGSSRRKTQKKKKISRGLSVLITVVRRLWCFKPSQFTEETALTKAASGGVGQEASPTLSSAGAGQVLLLCPAFTLKAWSWGVHLHVWKCQSRELAAWQDVVFRRELQEQGTGQL